MKYQGSCFKLATGLNFKMTSSLGKGKVEESQEEKVVVIAAEEKKLNLETRCHKAADRWVATYQGETLSEIKPWLTEVSWYSGPDLTPPQVKSAPFPLSSVQLHPILFLLPAQVLLWPLGQTSQLTKPQKTNSAKDLHIASVASWLIWLRAISSTVQWGQQDHVEQVSPPWQQDNTCHLKYLNREPQQEKEEERAKEAMFATPNGTM